MQILKEGNKIFIPIKEKWSIETPEEKIRQEYICRLVNNYGFNLDQMEQEVKLVDQKSGLGNAFADIVIWKSKKDKINSSSPLIVVECKAEQVAIREEDYYKGAHYAALVNAKFFVTTNLKETKIFSKIFKVDKKGGSYNLEEIVNIPKAVDANNEREINELLSQNKDFSRDEFSRLLFKCHNIIRNNDKLSPEAAFDEISKVLFIKTLYERNNQQGQIFLLDDYKQDKKAYDKNKSEDDSPFYRKLFDNVKEKLKKDDLFEPNETIKIRENSFEAIVKELEVYNLSTTSDDIKGIAFEKFLGRTFRGELGQFFTPRTVVDYMVEILDLQEGEKICDPCCGSGGFLIKAFEYVKGKIENDIQLVKEQIKDKYYTSEFFKLSDKKQSQIETTVNEQLNLLNTELDVNNSYSRLRKLSYECIYGTDANPRMARTAKMNMIMHGDGHGGVHHHDGLINVNGIFEGRFDVILTNPPFGARVERSLKINLSDIPHQENIDRYVEIYGSEYLNNIINPLKEWAEFDNGKDQPKGRSVLSLYETSEWSNLTEILFIERCLNLLRPGGRMGIVLPEGVLNNSKLQKVRDYVESKAKIINITSIPQDVFVASGATVKPSLIFFKKFTKEEADVYDSIKEEATELCNSRYKNELEEIATKLNDSTLDKSQKKELRERCSQISQSVKDEIKLEIKTKFDYNIPIVEVEKAGISKTGAQIDNELIDVAKEFKEYSSKFKLWDNNSKNIRYDFYNNKFQRVIAKDSPEPFYV